MTTSIFEILRVFFETLVNKMFAVDMCHHDIPNKYPMLFLAPHALDSALNIVLTVYCTVLIVLNPSYIDCHHYLKEVSSLIWLKQPIWRCSIDCLIINDSS